MGNFRPTLYKTPHFEVAYKTHQKNSQWPTHFQQCATEYNLLTHGEMRVNGITFRTGDIFVIPPRLVTQPEFLTDCEVMVVKVPSLPSDKVVVT